MKVKSIASLAIIATALISAGCKNDSGNAGTDARSSEANAPTAEAVKTPWDGNAFLKAVFPDTNAVKSIPLDYESFALVDNDGMSAVPLPPYLKMATVIHAMPNPTGYQLKAGTEQCKNSVVVKVAGETVATLNPSDPENSATVNVDQAAGSNLEIWLEDGAEVNFNCNVIVTPSKP